MLETPWKSFVHPQEVYRLEYPAHWDQLEQEQARSCGFGPHEREDVGLWITIMPLSVDTEGLTEELPRIMSQALEPGEAAHLRRDDTIRHYALKADVCKPGEGGHYWIVAGGDVVLFASSQVPVDERDTWNPVFERLMASLVIMRDEALVYRQIANEVLRRLRERYPEEDFEFGDRGIRGKKRMVFLANLYRDIKAAPSRRETIIDRFVHSLGPSADFAFGQESWDEIRLQVLPVLKPRAYIKPDTPTQHLLTTEWLIDVLICYVIQSKKIYRFITGWDLERWGTSASELHRIALDNLQALPWPRRLEGSRQKDGGRVILVETGDSLASSRLLHPDFHKLLSGPLGSPFWAGIPDRDTLVTFSDRRALKQRIARKLRKDHDSSAYPITPRPFLVTRDGIAPGDG